MEAGGPALNQTPACLQLTFLGEDAERNVVGLLGTARPARWEWSVGDEDRRRLVGWGKALGTALREPGAVGGVCTGGRPDVVWGYTEARQ